jgi:hypothetical protein
MCREIGIWRSGNKRALAAGLINWRDRCRARGKAFLTEMHSFSKSTPHQLTLRSVGSVFSLAGNDSKRRQRAIQTL